MHEFSLALNIVDIVSDHVQKEDASKVLEIELEVGALSGVVMDAMKFAMESAIKGTLAEGARINYELVKGKVRCESCHHVFETNNPYQTCPKCGQCAPEVIKGRELRVKSIVVD